MATTAHFLVNTLALQRGGLVKAVRDRSNALAASGQLERVEIDILGAQPTLAGDVAELKSSGHLHRDVVVRSVLDVLDDSGPEKRDPVTIVEEEGMVLYPADETKLAFRIFKNGVFERFVRYTLDGTLRLVDYFNEARQRVRRDEFDQDGRLFRILNYPAASKYPAAQRYIGRDGNCFLTIWQGAVDGKWGAGYIHRDELTFPRMGQLYAHALDKLMAAEGSPAITSEFRESLDNFPHENIDDVLRSLKHPHVLKIAVAHSNHFNAPFVQGSTVSRNWRRLLNHVDEMDVLVTLTQSQRKHMIEEAGSPGSFTSIGHAAPPEAVRTEVDPLRLVLVARTHPKKRVDEALRTFAIILKEVPGARLEIFGFGYGDAEEQKISDLITELGIADHVHFMPFTNDPHAIFGGACLTLFTSASEGFGMVLLESMSHGVPVVAYDINYGPSDVIDEGANGYLVPFENHELLARRSLQIMRDSGLRAGMEENCRTAAGRFGPERFVNEWLDVLGREPRPDRLQGSTIGPVVSEVRFVHGAASMKSTTGVRAGLEIVLKDRESRSECAAASLTEGTWTIELPTKAPGGILDVYARSKGQLKRVQAGNIESRAEGGWKAYATSNGALSMKRLAAPQG